MPEDGGKGLRQALVFNLVAWALLVWLATKGRPFLVWLDGL